MDNLVDGVEIFATSHPWMGAWWVLAIAMLGVALATAVVRFVSFVVRHVSEPLMRRAEVRDVLVAIALASLLQYAAHLEDRQQLQELRHELRELVYQVEQVDRITEKMDRRFTQKLDESACTEER